MENNEKTRLEEHVLDEWFSNLPACSQEEITGIKIPEKPTNSDYENYDNSVMSWWDELCYDDKERIYEKEN